MPRMTASIGNTDILITEILTMQETVIHARKTNYSKVIIEWLTHNDDSKWKYHPTLLDYKSS